MTPGRYTVVRSESSKEWWGFGILLGQLCSLLIPLDFIEFEYDFA